MKYRLKYEYSRLWGRPHHVWTCIGRHGAMHFHVTDHGEDREREYGQRYSGGLETHYRSPPDYMEDHAPSQDKCWLLKCPCWHDGTSLYATEHLIPLWLANQNDPEYVFRILVEEYEKTFNKSNDDQD